MSSNFPYRLDNETDILNFITDIPFGIWESHTSGRRTAIVEMEETHLLSAIEMLKRGTDYYGDKVPDRFKIKLPELEMEARHRGILKQGDWDE